MVRVWGGGGFGGNCVWYMDVAYIVYIEFV